MNVFTFHLHDEVGTLALGAALARVMLPGLTIHLHGELGAGKTALTRVALHAAGYNGHVKSPTYTLVESYAIQLHQQTIEIVHFDLYRLASPEEFLEAGFREYFNENNICIVEWPEKAMSALPKADISIFLYINGNGRDIKLQGSSDKGNQCLEQLKFVPNL